MRRLIRFGRPIRPSPAPVKPVLDYQSRHEADSQEQDEDRPWYKPDLRWKTNRETVVEFVGEFLALMIVAAGIVLAFVLLA